MIRNFRTHININDLERIPCEFYMSEMSFIDSMRGESDLGKFGMLNDYNLMEIFARLPLLDVFSILGLFSKRIDNILKRRIENCRYFKTRMRRFPNYKPEHLFEMGRHLYSIKITPIKGKEDGVLNVLVPLLQGAATTANLRSITLNNIQFSGAFAHALHNVIFQLKELDLKSCDLIDEYLIYLLPKALNLRTLKLLDNERLKGEFMHVLYKNAAGKCMLNALEIEVNEFWVYNPKIFQQEQKHMKISIFDKSQPDGRIYNFRLYVI